MAEWLEEAGSTATRAQNTSKGVDSTNSFVDSIRKPSHELLGCITSRPPHSTAGPQASLNAPHASCTHQSLVPYTSPHRNECEHLQEVWEHIHKAGPALQNWEKVHKLEHFRALPQRKETGGSQHLAWLCRTKRKYSFENSPSRGNRRCEAGACTEKV